ncbi:MAG: YciI family protein [Rhodocyclaceae bacterium]
MLYALSGEDAPGSGARRAQLRPQHLARLSALQAQGRVVLAGPLLAIDSPDPGPDGVAGSLIVAEFDSLEDARRWWSEDPYSAQGVFAATRVWPFRQVMP